MEALEFIQKTQDGRLLIELPIEYQNKELIVTITEKLDASNPKNWNKLPNKEKLKILKTFAGSAKYPDAETNKYDVYEQ